jgi:O-antigen ligase
MLKIFNVEKGFLWASILLFFACLVCSFIFDNFFILAVPFALVGLVLLLQDVRLSFYLMLFFIPFSFNIGDALDFPDEIFQLILTLFFIFFLFQNRSKIEFRKIALHPLVLIVLLSTIWLAITICFSTNPLLSSKYLLKKIWYLTPFLLFPIFFFQQKKTIIFAYQLIAFPLFLLTILITYRYSLLGFRFEDVQTPVEPFFQNHVIYGSMLSCMIPLAVAALFLSRKLSVQWIIALLTIISLLVATYFAYSRAAWVAVIFAAGIFISIRLKIVHFSIIGFFVLVFAGVIWLSANNRYLTYKPKMDKTIMHESLEDHIMATIQGTDISSAERYYRWIAALRMSQDYPVFGVGPNNWYENYKQYTIASFRTWVSRNPEKSTSHNYFLFMIAEQGYPAMILYAILIFAIFFYSQKIYHKLHDRFDKIVVISVASMIGALFINNFFSELLETDKIGSLFYFGISILVVMGFKANKISIIKSNE